MNLASSFPVPYRLNSLPISLSTPWTSPPLRPTLVPSGMAAPYATTPFPYPTSTLAVPKTAGRRSSFSNTRYNSLKQSRSFSHRRALPWFVEDSSLSHRHRPSRSKSINHLRSLSESSSTALSRAHSWHSMGTVQSVNYSVAYAKEMHLTPKSRRRRSMKRKKSLVGQLPPVSPQRRPGSFRKPRKPSIPLPERGVVRISTLDELPIPMTSRYNRRSSLNIDRLSTKGSITTNGSIKRQTKLKNQAIQTGSIKTKDDHEKGSRMDVDNHSSSSLSSNTSISSVQQQINNSLRNDPCISAAMKEFRRHRRNSDRSSTISPDRRHRSPESSQSDSTRRSRSRSRSPSRSISRSHSQSSFTSQERSEIRQIIKNIKSNGTESVESVSRSSSIPPAPSLKPLTSIAKPKKSLVAEELDREFSRLRALDPDQELTYVTPSSFCKRKKSHKRPAPILPPLPTLSEMLRQVQLRPVDKTALSKPAIVQKSLQTSQIDSIPVVVPQSSPIPPYESLPDEDMKHEYAKPMKKPPAEPVPSALPAPPALCRFQPIPSSSTKAPEESSSRWMSMFHGFPNNLLNSLPSTFQPPPTPIVPQPSDYATTSVNENIYASDIDVHLPVSTMEKDPVDDLQIFLENQTIVTDPYYSDYDWKGRKSGSSSIFHDMTRAFKRKHEQKILLNSHKHSRCSIM